MKKKTGLQSSVEEWLTLLLQGEKYKKELLSKTHPKLWSSNQWEEIRRIVQTLGVVDDRTSKYTKLQIPKDDLESVKQILEIIFNDLDVEMTDEEAIISMGGVDYDHDDAVEYWYKKLEGKSILHIMSPSRWSGSLFLHQACANYKVLMKTVNWLANCHHFILVPNNHRIRNEDENVTLIRFPYPHGVLLNRSNLNYKTLTKSFDFKHQDIDFIFNHQPELSYNARGCP